MKIIAYIAAAILIFFGVLFVWGAGGAQGGGWTWVCGGALSVLFGFGLIWFASQRMTKAENIKMLAGAPTVECPYCGTTYQLVEEPKW
jgi:hypothetical protein